MKIKGRAFVARSIPNMITLCAMCCGISSIKMAIFAHWELAFLFIVFAGILDVADGRIARILNTSSPIGAQLDSLSDFISFGVAPAFTTYLYIIHKIGNLGWIICLFYALCCGFRLARFNLISSSSDRYFVGMPSTMSGIVTIFPAVFYFATGMTNLLNPIFASIIMLINSIMMISRVKVLSLKYIYVNRNICIVLIFAMFFSSIFYNMWCIVLIGTIFSVIAVIFDIVKNRNKI